MRNRGFRRRLILYSKLNDLTTKHAHGPGSSSRLRPSEVGDGVCGWLQTRIICGISKTLSRVSGSSSESEQRALSEFRLFSSIQVIKPEFGEVSQSRRGRRRHDHDGSPESVHSNRAHRGPLQAVSESQPAAVDSDSDWL
jgi:hypothetical protein